MYSIINFFHITHSCLFFLTAPGAAPQYFSVQEVTDNSITLLWDPPSEDKQYGIITSYHLTYQDDSTLTNITTTNLRLILTKLDSNTTYTITIAAENEYGVPSKCLTTQ